MVVVPSKYIGDPVPFCITSELLPFVLYAEAMLNPVTTEADVRTIEYSIRYEPSPLLEILAEKFAPVGPLATVPLTRSKTT